MGAGGTSGSIGVGGTGAIIGTDGGPGGVLACTADLHSITDESGAVVGVCPPDQGCFEGKCIPACDAASGSKGNVACEFIAPAPPFAGLGWAGPLGAGLAGPCHAVFVANAWTRPANLTLRVAGATYDLSKFGRIPKGNVPNVTYDPLPPTGLPPDEVAILFLSNRPGVANGPTSLQCPVPPAVLQNTAVSGTGRGAAFEITTDTPVSAYAILPYGGAASYLPSATLLMPRTSWGTNYFAISPHDLPDPGQPGQPGLLWMAIVGTAAGTNVTLVPPVALPPGPNVAGAPAGQATSYTVGAAEVLQFFGANPTGTVIEADQPVGLFTGNTYLHIPSATSTGGGHDAAHQQIPHVGALGNEYVGAGVVTRLASGAPESVPYRLLGVVDGTTLTYDPAPPGGAPSSLSAGQVAQFESTSHFVVRSQDADHPFHFTQYMPGTLHAGGTRLDCQGSNLGPIATPIPGCGDEEWLNLLPPRQFLQKYVFFTDPTYSTTNLVITRAAGPDGFADVTVKCLGTVTGWQSVGTEGKYEVAYVDLMRAGTGVGGCATSQHVADSARPFGVTVWGTDWFASYGYPAGGNVGTINQVHVPAIPK